MENISCFYCRGLQADLFVKAQDFENPTETFYSLEKCSACGLVFQNPRPTTEELPQFYSNEKYYSYVELENKKKQSIGVFERLRHYLFERTVAFYYGNERSLLNGICAWVGKGRFGSAPLNLKPGKILDIGCGDGVFLDAVKKAGWETYGVEINADAAKRASESGLNVSAGDLMAADYPENFFDVVRMWSVLEHVPHPQEVLGKIRSILKPNGTLILQVPNIESLAYRLFGPYWTGLDLPRHLTHFSPQTIARTLEKMGYRVESLKCASVGTLFPSFKFRQRILRKQKAKKVALFDSVVSSLMRVLNVLFDRVCDLLGRGDCLVIWAKK